MENNLYEAERLIKCFSDQYKLRVLNLLMNGCMLTNRDISAIIGKSETLASLHMKEFFECRIVDKFKIGKYTIFYTGKDPKFYIITVSSIKKFFNLFGISDEIFKSDLKRYKDLENELTITQAKKLFNESFNEWLKEMNDKKKKFDKLHPLIKREKLKPPEYVVTKKGIGKRKKTDQNPEAKAKILELKSRIRKLESEKGLNRTTDK